MHKITRVTGEWYEDQGYNFTDFIKKYICTLQNHKWASAWDLQQCGMCDQQKLRSACAYAQSDQSLCSSLEYSMSVKLLTEHLLEVLSLKGGCRGSSESTHIKMSHCWKSHTMAQISMKHAIYGIVRACGVCPGQQWHFIYLCCILFCKCGVDHGMGSHITVYVWRVCKGQLKCMFWRTCCQCFRDTI